MNKSKVAHLSPREMRDVEEIAVSFSRTALGEKVRTNCTAQKIFFGKIYAGELASAFPPSFDEPTIYRHGERSYSIDGRNPICVSYESDKILMAFLEKKVSMTAADITKATSVDNSPRAIATLEKYADGIFKPSIRRPIDKGIGYFIRVKLFEEE